MKKLRKIIAIAIAMLMLAGMTALAAPEGEDATIKVSLRIEGVLEAMYYNKEMEIAAGGSIADLMDNLASFDGAPEIVSEAGYISGIGGLDAGAYGGWSGWSFRYNDEELTSGIGDYLLADGDTVVCYYGDPWGEAGMQYPVADLSGLFTGNVIKFTSLDTDFNTDPPTTTANPVIGATVTFNGVAYTTDSNGEIAIADMNGISGFRPMQIERYDEGAGVPTVLRYAPDNEIYVPFADTPIGEWYEAAVRYCVREWNYKGVDLAANLFEPMRHMTMAELVTVLARVAGVDTETQADPWYAAALEWAIEKGVVKGEDFDAEAFASKEEYLYMFYLTIALVGDHDMAARADITGAADYETIGADYIDAISWAVASGIVAGSSTTELVIGPQELFTRAMICQLLYNYLG